MEFTSPSPITEEPKSSESEQTILIVVIVATAVLICLAAFSLLRMKKERKRRQAAKLDKNFSQMMWKAPSVASTEVTVNEKTTVNDDVPATSSAVPSKKSMTKKGVYSHG